MIGLSKLFMYPNQRNNALTASGIAPSSKKGLTRASTKNGSQQTTKADMMIPRVVDAFRSLANWKRSFFWWGECDWWSKSLAMWLFWAKLDSDDRIRFAVILLLLSEDCLRLSLTWSLLLSGVWPTCDVERLMVCIGLVGVFCASIGHCDSLDFLCPLKHLPIVLSVFSTLIWNKI